jgi:protein gp37
VPILPTAAKTYPEMNRTKIPWASHSWNPVIGCSPISEGCNHCYATAMSRRFHIPWGQAHFIPQRLTEPFKTKKPARVFVCSMSDLGHPTVELQWIERIASQMKCAPQHIYMVLTKRPGPWLRDLPPECWVGVTIESLKYIDRWPLLWNCAWPEALKFVSVEPMLGPVTFKSWEISQRPEWVIAGPETGPGARPCKDKWIDALASESAYFFDKRKDWSLREYPHQ